MKVLDIALKDVLRYFRSSFAVGMTLVVPMLITGLIYAAFGGVLVSSETEAYTLPVIHIQIVNHDLGDEASGVNAGQYLIDALTSEAVKDVFAVTLAEDETAASAAVDRQEAAVALIIPAEFTQAMLTGSRQAQVTMIQDPTLSFGPGIVREVVSQFLDALSGGRIAANLIAEQLAAHGAVMDPAVAQQVQADYAAWYTDVASSKEWHLPVTKRVPNKETPKSVTDHRTTLLGPVMAGMMIFFVFFTGANAAQSILREQEEGTLARLFTTPTPLATILGGKFIAVFATLVVQSIVLIIASALVFGIDWGNLLTLSLATAGLVVAAAGFGILLMSFVKTTRQAGPVVGGVISMTGMAGGLFTTGMPGVPAALDTASLFLPQGWAMRGLKMVLVGAGPQDVLLPLAALLAFGLVFFIVGAKGFQKRFA